MHVVVQQRVVDLEPPSGYGEAREGTGGESFVPRAGGAATKARKAAAGCGRRGRRQLVVAAAPALGIFPHFLRSFASSCRSGTCSPLNSGLTCQGEKG
jgi:hypothetical protein